MSNPLAISEAASLALHAVVFLTKNCDRSLLNREMLRHSKPPRRIWQKYCTDWGRWVWSRPPAGLKGGFRLARPGSEINPLQVYEAIERPLADITCFLREPICRGDNCILGPLLKTVNRQAREHVGSTTVVDVINVYEEAKDEKTPENNQN